MTLEQLPLIMIRALLLTVAVECAIAGIAGIRNARDQITVVLANLLTNPLVVSVGAAARFFIGREALVPVTLAMEILTVLIEGIVYKKAIADITHPMLLSLTCNASSYIIGELLNRFLF